MSAPVAVHVRGAVGEGEVDELGVDHLALLSAVQQLLKVAEVAVAASNPVPRLVLVQCEDLARTEPALR